MDKDLNIIEKLKDNPDLLNSYLSFCNSNNHDIFNDELMEILIKYDLNYFKYYRGDNKNIINYAIDNDYEFTEEDFKNSYYLSYDDKLMEYLIMNRNINYFQYYMGFDKDITNYAIENGYTVKEEDFKKNFGFGLNNTLMYYLIKEIDINYFKYYKGRNDDIINYAIENGYEITEEDLKRNNYFREVGKIMISFIKKDVNYFKYYTGTNKHIINYALENGYEFTEEDFKNNETLCHSSRLIKTLMKKDVNYFKYYRGNNIEIINEALKEGYKVTEEDFKKHSELGYNNLLIHRLIKENINYFKYYKGKNEEIIDYAIKNNYEFTEEDLKRNNYFREVDKIMIILIKKDVNYFKYYKGKNEEIINYALENGYEITKEDLINNFYLRNNDKLMKFLIMEKNINYFEYYLGSDDDIIKYMIENNYNFTEKTLKKNLNLWDNEQLMTMLIMKKISYFEYYKGKDEKIMDYVASTGYIPQIKDLKRNNNILYHYNLMKNLIKKDYKNIKYYKGNGTDLYKHALKKGYIPSLDEVYNNETFAKALDSKNLENIIMREKDLDLIKVCNSPETVEFIKQKISQLKFNNAPIFLLEVMQYYKNNKLVLLKSIDDINYFLTKIDISFEEYIKNSLGSNYDWLKDIKSIINENKIDSFAKAIKYFFNNYYNINNKANNTIIIESVNDLLRNYIKYPELIDTIVNENVNINNQEKKQLNYLFSLNIVLTKEMKFYNINELGKIDDLLREIYLKKLIDVDINDNIKTKEVLCEILFNKDLDSINNCLSVYGGIKTLKQLKFNNKKNKIVQDMIDEIIIYTSIMEELTRLDDTKILKKLIKKVENNLNLAIECSKIFNNYEDKMKKLYELDLIQNLTVIDNVLSYDSILNKELSSKYGVDVIDFSNKNYLLIAHILSSTESIEELVKGTSKNKLFLSSLPISWRNQVYYYNRVDYIILATDEFPEHNFICSSIFNMGTNNKISRNSTEVESMDYRLQRGILETSEASRGYNAEIFSLREGIKFKYIVLPGGREPNKSLIEIAKKYNLKFIITQENKEMIENPEKIQYKEKETKIVNNQEIEQLKDLKNKLVSLNQNSKKRKVAILTDLHGLFEPTLAILEDARRKGITEIYSLGDNIGTGPNPKEVLELLDEYDVKSIKGNHELYVIDGVDKMQEHFKSYAAYDEALKNSIWTKNNLTDSQKDAISKYPDRIELTIGSKKVLLCHSIKDYNSEKVLVNTNDYDEIFQGHIHFENQDGNVTTVRGAAIGGNSDNYNQAYYLTLEELPNGGYTIEKNIIEYDINSLRHSINESEALLSDKEKINNWTGMYRK